MIESFLEFVFGNTISVTIVLLVGLFFGITMSLIYWRGRIHKKEVLVNDLEISVEKIEAVLNETRFRAKDLLNEKKEDIEGLNDKLKDYEIVLENRENAIDTLNTRLKDFEILLNEREKRADLLDTQLRQRDEKIKDLIQQINERDESINNFSKKAAVLEKNNIESLKRAEDAERKVGELEKSLEEQEQETTSLQARIYAMQDDFSYIMGIGPKVSSVLRFAGINTFAKLASADMNRITEILEEENPSILRLTDPSTWSEQARLISENDWEALEDLQKSLKASKQKKSSILDNENIDPVDIEVEAISRSQ